MHSRRALRSRCLPEPEHIVNTADLAGRSQLNHDRCGWKNPDTDLPALLRNGHLASNKLMMKYDAII